jgi:hypothetical protein
MTLSPTSRWAIVCLSSVRRGLTLRVPQTLAIQLGIKEAVVPTGTASGTTDRDFDLKKLRDVLDRCGIVITERKPSTSVLFTAPYLLRRFSQVNLWERPSRRISRGY